ncbi:MAG: TetM/TetW/TetO/TetS family tetracycline resistance ribosomal protection protein [Lachnospiraceae bacterium]|nr:TetM/TetW/TetO/TetS family tetracycline resistance ribosomal protection protein [Lachnospiraceae bacterium]
MKKLVIGILAHVDAGKTTMSEAMLFAGGTISSVGRVDHKDTFLDTDAMEKERGITIFSKQARFFWKDMDITLLDTPGHVDFSSEMERTLQVLDYAILVINGTDGVQGHTETLWKLLKRYEIPTFIFVNKMDLVHDDKNDILMKLKKRLGDEIVDFSDEAWQEKDVIHEEIAMCNETALEEFMENGEVSFETLCNMVKERCLFPCLFGSALKNDGIEAFLDTMNRYTITKKYKDLFSARVFKIARDKHDERLTYLKITGGSLKVKDVLSDKDNTWEEKVNQIRLYSGEKFDTVNEVCAGEVCAVTGLTKTYPGEGLGEEKEKNLPVLEPVLTYRVMLEPEDNASVVYRDIKVLAEEDPQIHIVWNDKLGEIYMQLMGEVQMEIIRSVVYERFGYHISFDDGRMVYKETIKNTVEGVGHFEPLRHYAEVHLLLEPGETGSGMQFFMDCSEDELDKNWQRLIYTHLEEKEHLGVLTGFPITDMKITIIAGRAHNKHTEGGDFRQATYRAIRQGLKMAESVVLEPYYEFCLELPAEHLGRAMMDIQRMNGEFDAPDQNDETAILKGKAPVACMRGYIREVTSYTHGKGKLDLELLGYFPCHNQEEVVETIGYDSETDLENPTSSVFCAHGAGFIVPWNEVYDYMHVESPLNRQTEMPEISLQAKRPSEKTLERQEADLQEIMKREFGDKKKRFDDYGNVYYSQEERKTLRPASAPKNPGDQKYQKEPKPVKKQEEYLLVDGYNIIFSWEELNELAKDSLDGARMKLMEELCNYQGYTKQHVIVVFDAYKVKGNPGSVEKYHNIHVVFTKEAETADMYIEKVTHEIGKKHKVTVATSDGLEQVIIMQQGALRLSAKDLEKQIQWTKKQMEMYLT